MLRKIKNYYHLIQAILANIRYGFPSRKLTVIGVTGTDGKTTTVSLIYHILKEAGLDVSMVSTVGAIINGKNYDVGFHVTTPSSWALQRFLKSAVKKNGKKKQYMVLETTSHALDQYRVWGIQYKIGVITNITREHLDYHKTYENYVKAKSKLLKNSAIAVINIDDGSYPLVIKEIKKTNKRPRIITYAIKSPADMSLKTFPIKTEMLGIFNTYNSLAAAAACKMLGVKDTIIKHAITSFVPPKGREEIVYKGEFSVMVDFAHTSNSFEQLLSSLRPKIKGRIIHVFGSAGLRDAQKRSVMGQASSKYSDVIILTSEDPRTESVKEIMDAIESGIDKRDETSQKEKLIIIREPDRKAAIEKAVSMAQKEDIVVVTGKAHEKSMNYGRGEEPWDEFAAVSAALQHRLQSDTITA